MLISPENNEHLRSDLPQLSVRLCTIAQALPRGGVICDVGSDHGAIPLFLLLSDRAKGVIVTDIHENPLSRAKTALKEKGLDGKASFYLTDGIHEVLNQEAVDAFVIAGMGGETIVGILSRALSWIKTGTTFLLQPMTKHSELRQYLYEFGFSICDEWIVLENEKEFLIIKAVYDGVKKTRNEDVYFFGEILPFRKDQATLAYWESLANSLETKKRGKEKAGKSTEEETRRLRTIRGFREDIS